MKRTTALSLSVAVAVAAGLAAVALPSCETVTCQVVGVVFANTDYVVAVGDSLTVSATTLTDCPDRISPAVNFSSSDPTVFTTVAAGDTAVRVIPVHPGTASLQGVSRDRPNLKATVSVMVTGPNP